VVTPRWHSPEAAELAMSRGVACPEEAVRLHVTELLNAAGVNTTPVRLSTLLPLLNAKMIREKEMLLEGALRPLKGGGFDIWVRKDRPVTRQRYSAAHELGHLLFYQYAPTAKQRQTTLGIQAPEEEERLCNVVAAEILMPQGLVSRLVEKGSKELSGVVVELSRTCETSLPSALIRVAQEVKAPGVLQLWRRDPEKGWERLYSYHTGRSRSQLHSYELDRWRETVADDVVEMGHLSTSSALFSSELRSVTYAYSEAVRAPSPAGAPIVVLNHRLGIQKAAHDRVDPLVAYRQRVYQAATAQRADPACPICNGTGGEYMKERQAVRVCACRFRQARVSA